MRETRLQNWIERIYPLGKKYENIYQNIKILHIQNPLNLHKQHTKSPLGQKTVILWWRNDKGWLLVRLPGVKTRKIEASNLRPCVVETVIPQYLGGGDLLVFNCENLGWRSMGWPGRPTKRGIGRGGMNGRTRKVTLRGKPSLAKKYYLSHPFMFC